MRENKSTLLIPMRNWSVTFTILVLLVVFKSWVYQDNWIQFSNITPHSFAFSWGPYTYRVEADIIGCFLYINMQL